MIHIEIDEIKLSKLYDYVDFLFPRDKGYYTSVGLDFDGTNDTVVCVRDSHIGWLKKYTILEIYKMIKNSTTEHDKIFLGLVDD